VRVALVHDKLTQFGGAERVVLALRRIWPDADLYTSVYDPELALREGFGEVRATFLQRSPRLAKAHHYFLPLYDLAFRRLRLDDYDVVVSSSSMFAKGVRAPRGVPHLCYCHTPTRFLWDLQDSLVGELPNRAAVRLAVSAMTPWLRRVDRRAAAGVDVFIANSTHVAGRVQRYYGRQATVIRPPVDVGAFELDFPRRDHLLVVARLFPYKRVDLVIEACNRHGWPLVIVGEGSDRPRLEALAGPTVEFLGWLDEADKPEFLGSARALVAPQIEDFGIAMVEAIAAGTPVIAYRDGGAIDIVEEGTSGVFFDSQDVASVEGAIASFDPSAFDRTTMRERAARFSEDHFAEAMRECVERTVDGVADRRK
jgi:glycosyltransferase involved in cell wall biosynthesis